MSILYQTVIFDTYASVKSLAQINMKRLNIIFIADEGESAIDILAQEDAGAVESQVAMLNQLMRENPGLSDDPEVKNVIALGQQVAEEEVKLGIVKPEQQEQVQPDDKGTVTPVENKDEKKVVEKSPLSGLPFFKEDGEEVKFDLKTLTPENFHEYAKSLGVEPTGDTWVGDAIQKAAEQIAQPLSKFEQQYKELSESILELPKEIQTAVQLHIDGKDWRSALGNGASIDLNKEFSDLTADEKIKVHNYYFPEDIIKTGEAIDSNENKKSIRAAEAQYKADKNIAIANQAKQIADKETRGKNFSTSVDKSIAELKREYPDFKASDLKAAEELIKRGGIYDFFFNKDGSVKPDAAKKLVFAQHGENILKVATSIAKNKGKSEGKSEVLAVVPGVDKNNNQGGTELTDVEKGVKKLLGDSMTSSNLTY